jgi:hypothetical protein
MREQTAAVTPARPDRPAPPFQPDPSLIDHLEGNERARRAYRKEAEKMRARARDEHR